MKYNRDYIISVHKYSIHHKSELLQSKNCGCFYCEKLFKPTEILDWVNDKLGDTALCPKCGIDSVLSDQHPVEDPEFLNQMNKYWF